MSKEFYQGLGKNTTWPDVPQAMSLTYDDVLIMPRNSEVESRRNVDTSVLFGPYSLSLPIVSAPMDTITGDDMVRKMAELGGIGALPRGHVQDSLDLCEQYSENNIPCLYSVGLKPGREGIGGYEHARMLKERGAQMVLLDVANGGTSAVKNLAHEIKDKLDLTIVAGNIATYEQAEDYQKYGIDIARVGIGGGGLCTTRVKTGIGVPQLSAIFETTETGIYVIADGGIKSPGDVGKALAAGAEMVMIGSMFGGTDETPGEIVEDKGKKKKVVRGQASSDYMNTYDIPLTDHRTAEGIKTLVDVIGPVENVVRDISGGLRSSMSYVGAHTLEEYYERTQFGLASAATQKENLPHIVFDRT